eukprot:SAG31_NODE_31937_length_362_cov_0.779468_1_plen_65_part_00
MILDIYYQHSYPGWTTVRVLNLVLIAVYSRPVRYGRITAQFTILRSRRVRRTVRSDGPRTGTKF